MKATHIVVVQAGWVFVGTRTKGSQPNEPIIVLENAACVHRWGTTRGLGEIAINGPTKETELNPCGTVEIPKIAELYSMPVDKTKWK